MKTDLVLPTEMRFIDFSPPATARDLRFSTMAVPIPKLDEVLLRVHAAGVNRPDLAQRNGQYPPPPDASRVLGLEVAGTVVFCGPTSKWKIGDSVCALTHGGGYAEYCAVNENHCLPVPTGWSFEEAAGLPENYFTVWVNVVKHGALKRGEKFLVHGGTSGIGTTAIQMARAFGGDVFATAGSQEKCAFIETLGAFAINYRDQDFAQQIKKATSGAGVDVILDMVGGDYTDKNLVSLAPRGRLVQIATLQGAKVSIDIRHIMMKRLVVTGSTLRPRTNEEKAKIADELREHVWPLLEASSRSTKQNQSSEKNRFRVIIDHIYPWTEVIQAHERMESGHHIGKLILKII